MNRINFINFNLQLKLKQFWCLVILNIIISEIICPFMNPLLLLLFLLLFTLASTLQTYPTHEFVTLDTVTDPDFGPLMSGDWSQRLPAEIRNYKEQILAKLHISHHEHRRSARMSHRLKVMERFQWFLFWFIFATLAINNKFLQINSHHTFHYSKYHFLRFSPFLICFVRLCCPL